MGNNLVPSLTILITFKDQALPKYIYLFMVRHPVLPYISRTSLCFSCYRFGHIGAQCKGRARRLDCEGDRHGEREKRTALQHVLIAEDLIKPPILTAQNIFFKEG